MQVKSKLVAKTVPQTSRGKLTRQAVVEFRISDVVHLELFTQVTSKGHPFPRGKFGKGTKIPRQQLFNLVEQGFHIIDQAYDVPQAQANL